MAAADSDSEFGYDFSPEDEEVLIQLASSASAAREAARAGSSTSPHTIPGAPAGHEAINNIGYNPFPSRNQVDVQGAGPSGFALQASADPTSGPPPPVVPWAISLSEDVNYPDLTRALSSVESKEPVPEPLALKPIHTPPADDDTRSPLERFRSYPRRPLTVSDLTSGAWCELQYDYTLTRLPGGKRTRTAAMKQGSKVHRKLEDEVHTTVQVEVMTKEDGFGLRLWNLVQGLRTLRDTGLTRELEVWGVVDGNVVNGVIDSVSYDNPDVAHEAQLSGMKDQPSPGQGLLSDYFHPKDPTPKPANSQPHRKAYLADVKTRGSRAPVSSAQLRTAKIQLLLYHRFLCDMAAGRLDYYRVLRRYGLDMDAIFSDSFISQIGELHDEIFLDAPGSSGINSEERTAEPQGSLGSEVESSPPAGPDLVKYSSLRELTSLVKEEVELAFPDGESSVADMLRVHYIDRRDGREVDLHDFPVSPQVLEDYLVRYMEWWRGERQANGVDIEEAFKCQSCEFAGSCEWREKRDKEIVEKAWGRVAVRRTGPPSHA